MLHEEVLVEILSKLPAKSVIRFTCVSKGWYALTKSSYFIARHLHRSRSANNPCSLLVSGIRTEKYNYKTLAVSLLADEETTLLNLDVSFPNYTSLSYLKWSVLLVGTADRGVYCLVSFSLHGEVFHVRPPPKELCFPENGHEYAYRIPLFSRNNSAAILASLHQMTDGEYFIEALWVISSSTTSTAKPAWVEQFRSRSKIYSGSRFVGHLQRKGPEGQMAENSLKTVSNRGLSQRGVESERAPRNRNGPKG
ncbi:hypothetical protein DVH24_005099 [Malus domestica]|uniref:F-box domain-containing protein n=1 Tax=Malus domestica TaxID=3750 RepID=A0A498IGD6_MALDO|nr:hypothetical protein DVH24_005099 [Malus domestica]